ncbi:MAG: RNase adapter RapZ [Bacillota bacterium]|nr:RNase adapter RapZ [Bacillota bacterium]
MVVVTGLSGAGKSEALKSLEDLGYFCVDNLPPALIPEFIRFLPGGGEVRRVALGVDIRGGVFFDSVLESLEQVRAQGIEPQILYLEANDEVLVRRYKETRRRHPLAPHGRLVDGLNRERERLAGLRAQARWVVDTSELTPRQLRRRMAALFGQDEGRRRMLVNLVSFGFKYGLPQDADLVLDVRYLPNPQYEEALRLLPGTDPRVRDFLFAHPETGEFLDRSWSFLEFLLPHYANEGKEQLTVGIGCTGGQHRSVALAAELGERIRGLGYPVTVEHRDVRRALEENRARREGGA